MDEQRLREIVREETERGSNRTIEFLTKVIGSVVTQIKRR